MKLTASQRRAFIRGSKTPDKILLNQVIVQKKDAEVLVGHGLWEIFYETFHGKKQPRYRITAAGRALLREEE